jgi:DNA mismatch repair ATPase MutS
VRDLFVLAGDVAERRKQVWWSIQSRLPSSVVYGAIELLQMCLAPLQTLRRVADEHAANFSSAAFRGLFAMLQAELTPDYMEGVSQRLDKLHFHHGVLMSAELGTGNEGANHVLRRPSHERSAPFWRLLARRNHGLSFRIDSRDEAGARALSDLRDGGLDRVAHAVAQAADHVLSFFAVLRLELAFYVGALNLRQAFARRDVPVCFPAIGGAGDRQLAATDLRDAGLVLATRDRIVGQTFDGDGKSAVIVTGANQGGKSTFLRSVGAAQVMAHSGLFVAAVAFRSSLCAGVFSHFTQQEDASLTRGKLDEELARMSHIVDCLKPGAMVLCNESFAATNEREGSEIAYQVVRALTEAGVRVLFVTHLYDFARRMREGHGADSLFLSAERGADGARPFVIRPGAPRQSSFAVDVYDEMFASPRDATAARA